MAIKFPRNPSDADTTTINNVLYTYDSDNSRWSPSIAVAEGAGGGVTTYATLVEMNAASATAGDLAFVTSNSSYYGYNGSTWKRVYVGVDETLSWDSGGSAPTALNLNNDGTPSVIIVSATDPEGFDVTYGYDVTPSNQVQATISQDSSVFTLTPGDSAGLAGTFTLRTKAFDGLNTIYNTTAITLTFANPITWYSSDQIANPLYGSISSGDGTEDTVTVSGSPNSATADGVFSRPLRSGKYYFEVVSNTVTGNSSVMVGIVRSDSTTFNYNSTDGWRGIYYSSGTIWAGNSNSIGGMANGDVLCIAYDNVNDAVWFRKNNGSWSPDDPVTGTGAAVAGTSGGPFRAAIAFGGTVTNFTANYNTGDNIVYTPPTGFTAH